MSDTINNIKKSIDSVEYDFVNFIQPETQKIGNKIIWISAIIILINLNLIKLSEIDSNGLKVIIKANYISYILLFINIYFYAQFFFLIKFDNLKFKVPQEIKYIINESENNLLIYTSLANQQRLELENIINEMTIVHNQNLQETDKQQKLEILQKKANLVKGQIDETLIKLKYFSKLIKETSFKMKKGHKYIVYNNFLNSWFPQMIFLLSILVALYKIIFRFV